MKDQTAETPIPFRRTEKGIAPRDLAKVLDSVLSMACKHSDQDLLEAHLRELVGENPLSFLDALGLKVDRTLQDDLTVMPTVPILLEQTDPERGRAHLVPLASEEFSADWGVRMIGRSHRCFNPRGYHAGSIWPLYTGWTAQAEYQVHRHEAGLAHLMAGLATVFDPLPLGHLLDVPLSRIIRSFDPK